MNPNYHQKLYVCLHVFRNERPVLLVARDLDSWSFVCGDSHEDNASAYRVVGMGHVLDVDPALLALLDLPVGWEAERKSMESSWIRTRCFSNGA